MKLDKDRLGPCCEAAFVGGDCVCLTDAEKLKLRRERHLMARQPWLTDGKYTRQHAGTTTHERTGSIVVNYRTPSTAGKTPLAACTLDEWRVWRRTAKRTDAPEPGGRT